MGILDKKKKAVDKLTVEDVKFVLEKLKSANYTGYEFEQFYQVWVKLVTNLKVLEEQQEP
jgi:hypothetical protein|tara:strand:- start:247 stop:426 length:180 start_codon:yes stop_codon:yes gene_type:complete